MSILTSVVNWIVVDMVLCLSFVLHSC